MTNEKPKMHTVVLKEKDENNKWISMDVDTITPTFPFGEKMPMIMAVDDDFAYFIPMEQVNFFQQNYGVKNDFGDVQKMMEKKTNIRRSDPSCV